MGIISWSLMLILTESYRYIHHMHACALCMLHTGDIMDSSECDVFDHHSYWYTPVALDDG